MYHDNPELHREIKMKLLDYLMELMDENMGKQMKSKYMPEPEMEEPEQRVEVRAELEGDEAQDFMKRLEQLREKMGNKDMPEEDEEDNPGHGYNKRRMKGAY